MAGHDKLRLVSARVTNFGCFHDSGDVPMDEVTALIAENENGKTTFLRALAWWDDGSAPFDEEDRWAGADKTVVLDLVAATFRLNEAAAGALRASGVAKPPPEVRVTRNTQGEYRLDDPATGEELVATKGPLKFDVAKQTLAELLRGHTSVSVAAGLAASLEKALPGSGIAESTIERARTEVTPSLEAAEQQALEAAMVALEAEIATPGAEADPPDALEILDPYFPKVIYYDELVDFVQDSVSYAEVTADPGRHRTMINLATIADVPLLEIANADAHTRQRHSHTAQKTLSDEFSKYWQGEPVTVYVQVDETQMTLTIEHKGRTQRPSRRSSGLKWQLGFFVNFTAEIQGDLSGAVLLLDEPGLHLHIKQQPKLLELFDALAKDGCRIVYATHLSHMLAPDKPHRFRPLVADSDTPGATKVVPDITAVPSKADVMQPVRQALGMGIADAIGFGGTNIIAEGWAERYVLLAMSEFCRDGGLTTLSTSTTVLPAGGSGKKMLPFAAMAVAESTKAVVLVDDDKAGRSTVTLLEKALPGAVPVVRTHEEAEQTNRELEDLIAPAFYVDLVNASHADVPNYKPVDLIDIDLTKPICNAVEERFKANALGKFQKLRPAMELQKRLELGSKRDDETLGRFASLFGRLNDSLGSGR
jgi:predicted ATP-dependent endonuclease of OLD family